MMEHTPNATAAKRHEAESASKAAMEADNLKMLSDHRMLFVNMALEMSWQLALVVLIPILCGYELDNHFSTSPWLTLIGLLIAAVGVFGVLIRIVRIADSRTRHTIDRRGRKS